MSRKSLTPLPKCEILTAQQIIDKIDSLKPQDKEKDYIIDDLNNKLLPLLHEIMHRINSTVSICFTTDEVLSSNFRARWVILTEKGIKYLKQALTSYIKAYSGVKHDLNSSLVRLRFVFYLFDKVEQHLKIAICDPIPENDPDRLFDFKKLTKAISGFEKVILTCYSFDKKKISKISDLKKLDHVVFTHQSKKKDDKQQLTIIIPYIKELFAFRSLFKAQLDMAYRDNSAEEQGVNYSNVLIEGYAITFPFKNKRLVPADVFSEMLFALFDCHQDEEYKEYPDDPYEISQTIMNIIFFWYQNYNEDFQSFYADEILQFMNNYCVQHFDVECVNVNLANKRIELQKKNKSTKTQKKKIKLCYINENVVADTLTEIDAYLYFKIPVSAYLSNSQLTQFSKDYFIEAISEIEERKKKYASFVKRLIDIDTNEAYQYFIGLCAALVYRCHNYFAAFTISSVLFNTLGEASKKFSLNSLEKNVKNQYDDLRELFPVPTSIENLKNFDAISKFEDPFIHDPLLMQAKGSDLMIKTSINLSKTEISPEHASSLNTFVKGFENSKIHYLNKPKTRVESVRPIIGFDLLEYLFKLPADENEEMVLAHYDKPTQVTVKKFHIAKRLELRSLNIQETNTLVFNSLIRFDIIEPPITTDVLDQIDKNATRHFNMEKVAIDARYTMKKAKHQRTIQRLKAKSKTNSKADKLKYQQDLKLAEVEEKNIEKCRLRVVMTHQIIKERLDDYVMQNKTNPSQQLSYNIKVMETRLNVSQSQLDALALRRSEQHKRSKDVERVKQQIEDMKQNIKYHMREMNRKIHKAKHQKKYKLLQILKNEKIEMKNGFEQSYFEALEMIHKLKRRNEKLIG
ncbi:Ras-GAP domain-containing protein [Entamoeba marina]